MAYYNSTLSLPLVSPSISEAADLQQAITLNQHEVVDRRLQILEDAVKQLQQYVYVEIFMDRLKNRQTGQYS
jgi:hypothetical protein